MKHQGTKTIETPRLILRQFSAGDTQAMYDNWASDPEVTRFLSWPTHGSPEITNLVLSSWIDDYQKKDFYQWAIVPKNNSDRPIGSISVIRMEEQEGCCEIGYCIGRNWWHRGITTEALDAVIAFLFREVDVRRVEARHDPNNPHSGGVMRKCGMTYEGTRLRAAQNNQGVCDVCIYAITKRE